MVAPVNTFPKDERICGKKAISLLMDKGHWGNTSCIRYCWMPGTTQKSRILVSVPKRHFKRAVKRNLLKRRMREAYRLNKSILSSAVADIMLVYASSQVQPYPQVEEDVKNLLERIESHAK